MRATILILALALSACGDPRVASGKQAAADLLKDPASAQFRDVKRVGDAVCGEINGKNGFGAYAGFTRFVAMRDRVLIEPPASSLPGPTDISPDALLRTAASLDFQSAWLRNCLGAAGILPAGGKAS